MKLLLKTMRNLNDNELKLLHHYYRFPLKEGAIDMTKFVSEFLTTPGVVQIRDASGNALETLPVPDERKKVLSEKLMSKANTD